MQTNPRSPRSLETLRAIALPALVVVLGLQMLRLLFPSLAWYLKDTVGMGSISLGGYAFGTFLVGYLAALLRRVIGPNGSLRLTAGAVALLRLVEQVVQDPGLDLWLSIAGSAAFVLFLPTLVGHLRSQGGPLSAPRLAGGLLAGLALDSVIRGFSGTLDLTWIPGPVPLAVVALLAAGVLWLLMIEPPSPAGAASEAHWSDALPLVGLGPYLVLQALIFQNQGWISEVGRVTPGVAFLILSAGNGLALAGAAWGFAQPRSFRPGLAALAALYLGIAVSTATRPGIGFLLTSLVSQFVMGWAWSMLAVLSVPSRRRGLARTTLVVNSGMILFLLLAFVYYVSLDLPIPVPRSALPPSAAVLLGLAWLMASFRAASLPRQPWTGGTLTALSAGLLTLGVAYWGVDLVAARRAEPQARTMPLKVMTYNIHSAYNTAGRQDPEQIARVIEASGADVVALQEVSRGWLINGSTDLPAWFSRRLGMRVLFKGTAGPVWGNAILTRVSIEGSGWGELPLDGTLLPRGYLWADLRVGAGEPLRVINTHLHHIEADNQVRLAQVPVLLDFWGGRPFAILLGDLNAEPGYPEMDLIREAGLVDSWAEAGSGEGMTWPSYGPFERIDWIWHTSDLVAREVRLIPTTASDHLPILVSLEPVEE